MIEKEFNLLDERWIRVIDSDCAVHEVSLIELFRNAHEFKDLSGELPAQDFAVMRLLLAILHTVFSRYDLEGKKSDIEDADEALDRWKKLSNDKRFPIKVISRYLEDQRESFYLFHPERPFYQCEHAKAGTRYPASKLNGKLSESNHKNRLFRELNGKEKMQMSFAEAVRWLIYINAYDDTSAKPLKEAGKKLPSAGIGWLGKLGIVYVLGNNLFETLMLNLIMVKENGSIFGKEKPLWERKKLPDGERVKISLPDNLSELYTLQSRRIYLERNDQKIIGYNVLGGDYFDRENAFIEPMTIWKNGNKKNANIFIPCRHDPSKQFWREYAVMVMKNSGKRRPGIMTWINQLQEMSLLENRYLNVKIVSVQYGDKDFFIKNVFSDSLHIHASLIDDLNKEWQQAVQDCIEFSDMISKKIGVLAKNVNLAAGGSDKTKDNPGTAGVFAEKAKAGFYHRLDAPFRRWLCLLNPESDDVYKKKLEWRNKCIDLAREFGETMVHSAGSRAIFGSEKNGEVYAAADAMNRFFQRIKYYRKKVRR